MERNTTRRVRRYRLETLAMVDSINVHVFLIRAIFLLSGPLPRHCLKTCTPSKVICMFLLQMLKCIFIYFL